MNHPVISNMPKRLFSSAFIQKRRTLIIHIISALLILLFTYTSFSKLLSAQMFYDEMNNQPLPNWMTPYLVWGIPSVEILVSVALMYGKTRKLGLYASVLLMAIFSVYVSLAVFNVFERTPCSCGGVIKELNWTQHLIFNPFFLIAAFWGLSLIKTPKKNLLT